MTLTSPGQLAKLVDAALKSRGINQADLAREMDVAESTLSTWIHRPKRQIPVDTVILLARHLRIHVADVFMAYMADAGADPRELALPDSPYRAVVDGAMGEMSERAQQRLAQIAQDFRDDEK